MEKNVAGFAVKQLIKRSSPHLGSYPRSFRARSMSEQRFSTSFRTSLRVIEGGASVSFIWACSTTTKLEIEQSGRGKDTKAALHRQRDNKHRGRAEGLVMSINCLLGVGATAVPPNVWKTSVRVTGNTKTKVIPFVLRFPYPRIGGASGTIRMALTHRRYASSSGCLARAVRRPIQAGRHTHGRLARLVSG